MKHTAKHLDNGFYLVSDRAAGALVRVLGQKLPRIGWEKFVMVRTADGRLLNAWLKRTDTRHTAYTWAQRGRGWHWALHSLRADGPTVCNLSVSAALGQAFTFEAIASTQSIAA